jgi:hypothetical protein
VHPRPQLRDTASPELKLRAQREGRAAEGQRNSDKKERKTETEVETGHRTVLLGRVETQRKRRRQGSYGEKGNETPGLLSYRGESRTRRAQGQGHAGPLEMGGRVLELGACDRVKPHTLLTVLHFGPQP